jgi:AraC-like DNA-binding protein
MADTKPPDVNCARKAAPALGVKRFPLSQLFSGNGCAIDHSEPHRLHFNVAILVTEGQWEHRIDFSPLSIQAGDLLLLRAGQVHAFGKNQVIQGEILTFTREFLGTLSTLPSLERTIYALLDAGPRVRLGAASAASALTWYEEFSGELARRGHPYSEERITYCFSLLVSRLAALPEVMATAESPERAMPTLAREFSKLLEANFLLRRDPGWYAERLGVSTRTLDRRLARSLKSTCKELITQRLVLEAKRLLTDSEVQVKNVAHSLQFDEIANFSRFFRHNAGRRASSGCTPRTGRFLELLMRLPRLNADR